MMPFRYPLALPPDEKLFVLLVGVLGVPAGRAYQIAFPTKANMSSATSMASKMLRATHIQKSLWMLQRAHEQGRLEFNDKVVDI